MKNGNYAMYLRKSRADREAEARGEMETLARHEKLLFETAKRMQITVSAVYKEIVSGETISARPVMQKLLAEIEQGIWDGVLVVEVERLARGDTIDQGIVSQAFKLSDTKIITPVKVYDPNNEFDEEYLNSDCLCQDVSIIPSNADCSVAGWHPSVKASMSATGRLMDMSV